MVPLMIAVQTGFDGSWHLWVYCALIVVASLLGGLLPSLVTLTHKRMQIAMSVVGGLMLGIALFHMLPHALNVLKPGGEEFVSGWMLAGLLTMFLMLRLFHFHHHDAEEFQGHRSCGHDHDESLPDLQDDARHGRMTPHELSWLGVFLGLGLHTLIDGLALAASVQQDAAMSTQWRFFGIGTFLAIVVHKPLDAVSITSLMSSNHWTPMSRMVVNAAFALMCPIGAALLVLGLGHFSSIEELLLGGALAFSAGVFLCISLSDLLPEMEFHSHDRIPLTIALLLGIALAWVTSHAGHVH